MTYVETQKLLSHKILQYAVLCSGTAVKIEQKLILVFQASAKLIYVADKIALSVHQNRSARAF